MNSSPALGFGPEQTIFKICFRLTVTEQKVEILSEWVLGSAHRFSLSTVAVSHHSWVIIPTVFFN